MKSGIGVSEKLATEPTLLRASCTSPGSPPSNSQAPITLITRNENATGRPRNSSTVEPPSISQAAASQDIGLARRYRVVARRALGVGEAAHAEQHLERQREERHREHAEEPPLGRDQCLDRHRPGLVAGECGAGPVERDYETADEAHRVRHPLE